MIKLPVCTENCSNYDKLSKNLESKELEEDSMINTYKVVDEKTWERAMHCMIFRNSVEPAFCVTFDVDVTNFLKKIREQNYVELAAQTIEGQKEYFTGPLGNDVFQCSSMPWVTYTHISHTNSGKKDNATPLFDWGKYYEKDGRLFMPLSVQAHHSFVDGIHIGKYADKLQKYLNEL